jgi:hypothetical protein
MIPRARLTLWWLWCLLLLVGCSKEPSRGSDPSEPGRLKGRLNAALGMSNLNQRDDALKVVVQDAATAGDVEIVNQGLEKFTNGNLRDDVAAAAALTFSAAGRSQDAADIAKHIANGNQKDDVLKKIAQRK